MSKRRIVVLSLSGCSGCISSLISLRFLRELMDEITIMYFPFVLDVKKLPDSVDIAIIEGSVTDEAQIEILTAIRNASKKIIALGTCARHGGVPSMSTINFSHPISTYIEVDVAIPGCPPPERMINESFLSIVGGRGVKTLSRKNLCASCPRRDTLPVDYVKNVTHMIPIEKSYLEPTEKESCFLAEGILCLGPVTMEGCEASCIHKNMPCEGCLGPVVNDFTGNVVNFVSTLPVSKELSSYKGLFFRFSKPRTNSRDSTRNKQE
ncbi:MAG: hypothetical protein ACTSUE_21305 [Promethearchaeota archaeon]